MDTLEHFHTRWCGTCSPLACELFVREVSETTQQVRERQNSARDEELMPVDTREYEALLVANLHTIERAAHAICRRHGMRTDEVDDFASLVKLRLVEKEYAILRRFRGDSSIATYLTVVVAMVFRDYSAQRWGRWRPSAAALKEGWLGVRLETLIYRDGTSFDAAYETIRATAPKPPSRRELLDLLRRLPARRPLKPMEVGMEPLAEAVVDGADACLMASFTEDERRAVESALTAAMDRLTPEDRLILRLRYWESLSIADVARALGLPQKSLYRRIEVLIDHVRRDLEAHGFSNDAALVFSEDWGPE